MDPTLNHKAEAVNQIVRRRLNPWSTLRSGLLPGELCVAFQPAPTAAVRQEEGLSARPIGFLPRRVTVPAC